MSIPKLVSVVVAFLALSCGAVPFAHAQGAREVPANNPQVMLSFAPVVKKAAPAVVNIYTKKRVQRRAAMLFDDPFFQHFFGGAMPQGPMRERLESSLGSGVIIDPSGLVVTSHHVVEGADEIKVVLSDRREFDAQTVTTDEKADLAVLRIAVKGEPMPYLDVKDSDDVEVGDIVLAIGNPFGVGQTVTNGIVSGLARTNLDITDINYFIQTDAAINPGNSGGALVTMDGKLIGINSAIFSRSGGSMGLGFAVPSNMVRAIAEGVAKGQKRLVRPWTGVKGQAVTGELAASLGMTKPEGLLVNGLHPASPLKEAGIRVGDVITHVGGKTIEDPGAFAYRIATMAIGGTTDIGVLRAGNKTSKTVRLIAPPEVPARHETTIEGPNPLSGAVIANLSPALADAYGLPEDMAQEGVVFVSVARRSAAARFGLAKGDVVLKINGASIGSVDDVLKALGSTPRVWDISIRRGNDIMSLVVQG